MHDLWIALIGGGIGALVTAGIGFWARVRSIPTEVATTNRLAHEYDEDLATWVADEHTRFKHTYKAMIEDLNRRRLFHSGHAGLELGLAKEETLQKYRDQERRAMRGVASLEEKEGWLHQRHRRRAGKSFPTLTTPEKAQPVLDTWRKPVTRHLTATDPIQPIDDPTRRSLDDAVADAQEAPDTFA
jgi:hypothetical protein